VDGSLVIAGIPIPSRDPRFLALLAVHIPAGIVATVSATVAVSSPRRPGRHPMAGSVYYWAYATVFATALGLTSMRPAEDWLFALVGGVGFSMATLGRQARRRTWHRWIPIHIVGMGSSLVLMLTAFYIDNAPHLPVWRDLPTWAVWTIPSVVGVPFIVRSLLHHRRPT
jgi:cell division protein FtsW (lipid II flippase)